MSFSGHVSELTRKYSRALGEITKANGTQEKALDDLQTLKKIFDQDATIAGYFRDPQVSPDQKTQLVKAAFANQGLSPDVLNFILVLAQNHRMGEFPAMVLAYQETIDKERGVTRGTVRAAKPLTPEEQKSLEEKISSTLKRKILLTFKQDPKILGGLIAEVGGWTFDDSLENHLRKLNEELNRSAN